MSFYTGTQVELLYAQPANCTAVTAAAQTVLTGTPAASNPPYQLPAYFFNPGDGGVGKHLRITGGGFFTVGSTAVTEVIELSFDPTKASRTGAITLAKTGAFTTTANVTNGAWYLDALITCQQVGTTTNLNVLGTLDWGTGNNAATVINASYMLGAPNTSAAIDNSVAYYPELWGTWSVTTGAPSITCTQLNIYGCN
jgi:hypothetical protein